MDQDILLGKVGQINHRAPGRGSHLPHPCPASGSYRRGRTASHLGQCLHVDDVDEAEEERHLRGDLGYVSKQAALGQDLSNWGQKSRGLKAGLWLRTNQGHATRASSHALPGVPTPELGAQATEAATGTQACAASQEEPTFSGRPSRSSPPPHPSVGAGAASL